MGANSALQFVDTNVRVYAHDISAGAKHKRAEHLVAQLEHGAVTALNPFV